MTMFSTVDTYDSIYTVGPLEPYPTGVQIIPQGVQISSTNGSIRDLDVLEKMADLEKKIDAIAEIIGHITRSSDIEKRWAELRELGEKYNSLKQKILEKEEIFNILGGLDK